MSFYKIFPQPYRQALTIATQDDDLTDNNKIDLGRTAVRVALAAIGMLATYQLGLSLGVAVTTGAVLSPPALVIAGGSWLIYNAVIATATAISSASFAGLGTAIAGAAAGVYILENYTTSKENLTHNEDIFNLNVAIEGPIGLLENLLYSLTKTEK